MKGKWAGRMEKGDTVSDTHIDFSIESHSLVILLLNYIQDLILTE